MFNFGEFYEINEDQANFSVWELALFILIGSLGGIIGAATVHASTALTYRRMKQTPQEKQREVLGVALVMTLVSFFLPLWLGKCSLKPDPEASDAAYTSQVIHIYLGTFSNHGAVYPLFSFRCIVGLAIEIHSSRVHVSFTGYNFFLHEPALHATQSCHSHHRRRPCWKS